MTKNNSSTELLTSWVNKCYLGSPLPFGPQTATTKHLPELTYFVNWSVVLATNPAIDFFRFTVSWKQSIPTNIAFFILIFLKK